MQGIKNEGMENPEKCFRKASPKELQRLTELVGVQVPKFTGFYAEYCPRKVTGFHKADVRFLNMEGIMREAEEMAPGCFLKDFDNPEKIRIDETFVSKESEEYFSDGETEASLENVRRGAIELEGSFVRFLQKLSNDQYDDVEKLMDEHAAWH